MRAAIASLMVRAMAPTPQPTPGPFGALRDSTRRNLRVQREMRAWFGGEEEPERGEHREQ